ncbi:protein HflC [Escherichia coli]|uniref:Protein HflC n=1 Tax=Escherichia coli TaxID=562 RepID=A0A376LGE7_ECOLX|nr:protein HflC [Escherichia coli]
MRKSVIAIIIIVLVVLYMSVFVVKEGERGITLRFGKYCVTMTTNLWFMSRVCISRYRSLKR